MLHHPLITSTLSSQAGGPATRSLGSVPEKNASAPPDYNPGIMPDDYDRKPPLDNEPDPYELAEDPSDMPAAPPPPPPGLDQRRAVADDPLPDPMADDSPTGSSADGGKGAASHFSGDDPDYVNPEIARMRREEQRVAAAAEEAADAAKRQKIIFGSLAAVLAAAALLYVLVLA